MTEFQGEQTFKTTQWSLILSSRESDQEIRRKSLSQLCESYWFPLFVYLRRKGHSPDDSADYVQGFFSQLIEKEFLESASPDKGRFRWFLMSAIQRHVAKQTAHQNAQKRGGGQRLISIDLANAEERYQLEPVDGWTPEKLFERRWALEVLQQALKQLETEQTEKGKFELYQELQSTLSGVPINQQRYQEIASQFSMSAGAVKVAALRLREKYRKILQQIVAQTIDESDSIDDELEALLAALRG